MGPSHTSWDPTLGSHKGTLCLVASRVELVGLVFGLDLGFVFGAGWPEGFGGGGLLALANTREVFLGRLGCRLNEVALHIISLVAEIKVNVVNFNF